MPSRRPSSILTRIITQLVAVLVLIGILVIMTKVAPVSWILFERTDGRVRARMQECVFFVVPYRTVWIDPVTKFDTRTETGSVTRERRPGGDRITKADDNGYFMIGGPNQSIDVNVAPSSLAEVVERTNSFLADPNARELKLFVVANWTFSLIFSGLATLLYGFIAVCYMIAIVQGFLKMLGRSQARR